MCAHLLGRAHTRVQQTEPRVKTRHAVSRPGAARAPCPGSSPRPERLARLSAHSRPHIHPPPPGALREEGHPSPSALLGAPPAACDPHRGKPGESDTGVAHRDTAREETGQRGRTLRFWGQRPGRRGRGRHGGRGPAGGPCRRLLRALSHPTTATPSKRHRAGTGVAAPGFPPGPLRSPRLPRRLRLAALPPSPAFFPGAPPEPPLPFRQATSRSC